MIAFIRTCALRYAAEPSLRQSRKAEAEARRQAEQGERERAEFEAGAVNHAGRKALLEAVAASQEVRNYLYASARKHSVAMDGTTPS